LADKLALEMVMYTCPERRFTRAASLASLGQTDWRADFRLVVDVGSGAPSLARMATTFVRALDAAASSKANFVLVVEDDLRFNRHLEHNVREWVSSFKAYEVGSLYRSSLGSKVGTQALLSNPKMWRDLWRLASMRKASELQPFDAWLRSEVAERRFRTHAPSLVQHSAHSSTCGHPDHQATSFDEDWRA
jgi:hypothetical protein